jgi:methylated-DNA-[protein]-cysteine S-methyltransferase
VNYVFKTAASPVGLLKLVANDAGLAAVLWQNDDPHRVRLGPMVEATAHPILIETGHQLAAYFEGSLKAFDIPLDFKGTEFQKIVWAALLTIPFGETRSYGQIARQIGHPAAVRAVGAANGRNPISIVAPCHRVVGASGALTGFAGGLGAKRYLLDWKHRARTTRIARMRCRPASRLSFGNLLSVFSILPSAGLLLSPPISSGALDAGFTGLSGQHLPRPPVRRFGGDCVS